MSENRPMTSTVCDVRFLVEYPPFPSQLSCELERYHNGPHQALGFAWGPLDQSQDFQVQHMRKADEERRDKVRGWHKLLRK